MSQPARRKNKGPNFNVYIGVSFPNEVVCEIERLANSHGLMKAPLVRELFFRGLAAYYRDGQLNETTTDLPVNVQEMAQQGVA